MVSLNIETGVISSDRVQEELFWLYKEATSAKKLKDYSAALAAMEKARDLARREGHSFDSHKYARYKVESGWQGNPWVFYEEEINKWLSIAGGVLERLDQENDDFWVSNERRIIKKHILDNAFHQHCGYAIIADRMGKTKESYVAEVLGMVFLLANVKFGNMGTRGWDDVIERNLEHAAGRVYKRLKEMKTFVELDSIKSGLDNISSKKLDIAQIRSDVNDVEDAAREMSEGWIIEAVKSGSS
jgi:hypothetical protein